MEEVIRTKEEIEKSEAELKKQLNIEKEERQVTQNKKESILGNLKTLNQMIKGQEEKLKTILLENDFDDAKTAWENQIPKADMKVIEEKVNGFMKEYSLVEDNINSLKTDLGGQSVDEEKWTGVISKLQELAEVIEENGKKIGAKINIFDTMKSNLQIVLNLTHQKEEIQHSLDLLEDLDKLITGNKFVEFVAMSQLEYISKDASSRLKEITRGRYALELNPDGDFIMRDDFNGGSRRATNTLSGGETFLTSLSLALALSSQIQLKGNAPLEFFFLDEGFGTLDMELLEVVMSSLERLHSDNLCVGIISHVEELKNRVPVKLIVTPAQQAGNGSKVKIEYS